MDRVRRLRRFAFRINSAISIIGFPARFFLATIASLLAAAALVERGQCLR